ncbi:MAG: tripartite tricarboxylate transporter permease [Planctomycetes bacterium]|nr:tripartite tricarboxylate transporter permease [Planctomycetota bacterium]
MQHMFTGFATAMAPINLLMAFLGTGIGIFFGALPGLTSTMAVGLLIPVTFGFQPATGLIFLAGAYCGSMYGGSISAILLNTPGTPASAATSYDGFPMTNQGQGGKALAVATVASFTGGIFSALCLILIAPPLARLALLFGPGEYFAVAIFGLTVISAFSAKNMVKGVMAGIIGLLVGTIGMDPINGYARFTFNRLELFEGISIIPALIGLFSASQVLMMLDDYTAAADGDAGAEIKTGRVRISWRELLAMKATMIRSSVIGTLIGIIPAAGGDIASFIGYNEAVRFSRDKASFGHGNPEGVAASEAANNGVTGGSLIPLLTLGIPGNSVTAIFLGGLMIQGLRPGPSLFSEQAPTTYAFFAGLILANIAMLILGLIGSSLFVRVLGVPAALMIPLIFSLCVIGSYSIRNSLFDVIVMMIFGGFGFFLRKLGFSSAPVVLGIILGPMAESNFRRVLQVNQGSLWPMFASPIVLVLVAISLVSVASPIIMKWYENRRAFRESGRRLP